MLWQIGKGKNGGLVSTIQTPSGVLIKPGVQLKLGQRAAGYVAVYLMRPAACLAGLVMDDSLLKQATAAQKADVVLQAVDGRRTPIVSLPMH